MREGGGTRREGEGEEEEEGEGGGRKEGREGGKPARRLRLCTVPLLGQLVCGVGGGGGGGGAGYDLALPCIPLVSPLYCPSLQFPCKPGARYTDSTSIRCPPS